MKITGAGPRTESHHTGCQIIGFHRALPPFTLRRMDWREHPLLQKRRTVPPKLPDLPELSDPPTAPGTRRGHYIDPDRATAE